MKYLRFAPRPLWIITIIVLVLASVAALRLTPIAHAQDTPADALQRAWQAAEAIAAYRYHSTIDQTSTPLPTLANVGTGPRQQQIYLEGSVDRAAQSMQMKLWNEDGNVLQGSGAIELEVKDGIARGRVDGGDWEEVDDFSNFFAPGQDPLAFVRAAHNVTQAEARVLALPDGSIATLRRYLFDLDGKALARLVRANWEESLRRQGKLPAHVTLELPGHFVKMTGHGELWVDERGLPQRLHMDLSFPPANGEESNAVIVTDFSGWEKDNVAAASTAVPSVGALLSSSLQAVERSLPAWLSVLTGVILAAGIVALRRSRLGYGVLVGVIIASMLITPILQAEQTAAFAADMDSRARAADAAAENQRKLDEQKAALYNTTWDPHADPLASTQTQDVPQDRAAQATPALPTPISVIDDGTDSDGDGVTDAMEEAHGLNPAATDSDSDGLSDGVEVYELGTNPATRDSDFDGLSDGAEVRGFVLGGRNWYLNPMNPESSGDGLIDGVSCTESNGTLTCLDTDGDNQPNAFDPDDDNDGVPDSVDTSPALVVGDAQNGLTNRTFTYALNQLAANKPIYVDFQLRPTNPAHLWYSLSVLDWPSGDRAGQVQRVFNTTFYDNLSAEEQANLVDSTTSSLRNGDLRLVPLLEIAIPFDATGGNLPKLPNAPTISASTPITAWLDVAAMQSFGISVRKANEAGDLLAYVPLSLVREDDQNGPVAFGGRMLYRPTGNLFGAGHSARLLWLVETITDRCKEMPADYAPADVEKGDRYDHWCGNNANWEINGSTIVHTYADDWVLTGFEVKENLGMNAALIYTDPARRTATPNTLYEEELWQLTQGLDQSWLAGRDNGNNGRDVTVQTVGSWFAESGGGCAAFNGTHPWQWNLSSTALRARCFSYADVTGMGDLAGTRIPAVLQDRYTPQVNGGRQDALILALREERSRHLPLDLATLPGVAVVNGRISANSLTLALDPATVKPTISAAMNWIPYRWNGVDKWEVYALDQYAIAKVDGWQSLLAATWTAPADAEAAALFATGYFLTLASGTGQVVEYNNAATQLAAAATDAAIQTKLNNSTIIDLVVNTMMDSIYSWTIGTRLSEIGSLLHAEQAINNAYADAFQKVFNLDDGFLKKAALENQAGVLKPSEFISKLDNALGTPAKAALMKSIGNGLIIASGLGIAASVAGSVAAVTALGVSLAETLGATISQGVQLAVSSISIVANALTVASFAASVFVALKTGVVIAKQSMAFMSADVIFFAVSTLVSIGFFIANTVISGISASSLAFGAGFADLVAGIVVGIVFLVIAAIPVIGQLIVAIVALIDSIITAICQATGILKKDDDELGQGGKFARDYVCPGISGILQTLIVYLYYSQTPLVDLANEGRLNLTNFDLQPVDAARGFAVSNSISVTLDVDTALYQSEKPQSAFAAWYNKHFTDENLRESTFVYQIQLDENALDESLELGTMADQWQVPAADGWAADSNFVHRTPVQSVLAMTQPGINQLTDFYLSEGYIINAQECGTPIPFIPICWLKSEQGTNHIPLGDRFVYDVFPSNLVAFRTLESSGAGAYRLNWGGALRFPALADADGDGLRSEAVGGNDPNDSNPDSDGDRLSDFYEIFLGFDPTQADADGDTLRDDEEVRLGTNPRRADSDGDGLTDAEEIAGWQIVYAFNGNTPQRAFVQSNPLLANADGDDYIDSLERTYGYHPNVPSTGDPLSVTGTVADKDKIVRPSETIQYTATVENNLRTSFAQGRLDVDFAGNSVPPRAFELAPGQVQSTAGTVNVTANASQIISLTNTAGAQIVNALTAAGGLSLWLDFAENAAPYIDKSFLNRTATCSPNCPAALANEFRGRGLTFNDNQGLVVNAPLAELGIDGDGFTFAAYMRLNSTFSYPLLAFDVQSNAQQRLLVVGNVLQLAYNNNVVNLATLPSAGWFHLTWRVEPDGTNFRHTVFVDGQQVGSTTSAIPYAQAAGTSLRLGDSINVNTVGTISLDEVMLFQGPISQDEITDVASDLVFHLDGRYGTNTDASAYSNSIQCAADGNGSICPSTGIGPGGAAYRVGINEDQSMYVVQGGSQLDLSKRNGQFSLAMFVFAPNGGWVTGNPNQINSDQPFPALRVEKEYIALHFGQGATTCSMQASVPGGVNDSILLQGWHHVAATFDGTTARLYLDGAEIGNQNCANARPGATSTFHLGGYDPNQAAAPLGMNYSGFFDDVRIYNYALTPDNLRTLINFALPTLDLRMDEPPARESFTDHSQSNRPGTCLLATNSCPFSGLPGRVNQGVQFDGVNDVISTATLGQLGLTGGSFTAAAWVKVPTTALHPVLSAGQLDLTLVNDGGLKPRFTMPGAAALTGPVLQVNRWHHIVWRYTFSTTAAERKIEIFVDGVKHAAAVTNVPALTATNETLLLGRHGSAFFNGMIDDVKLYSVALTDAQIVDLHKRAPVLNLHLDAPAGDFAVTNDAVPWLGGECSFPGCPRTGIKGKVYRGFAFDGVDDKVTVPNTLNSVGLTTFSLGLWFKPTTRKNVYQTLVTKERASDSQLRNYGLFIQPNSMDLHYSVHTCGNPSGTLNGVVGPLFENQWNHAMLTYDGKTLAVYINGFRAATQTGNGPACAGVGDFVMGTSLNGTRSFAGEMDEVVLYPLALSAGEVADLFRYQQDWFDTEVATPIVVDAVAPTVSFDIGAPILARRSVLLAGTATDDLSGTAFFLYRVLAPGSGASVPFNHATRDGNSWIFPFTPTVDGQHIIQVFAEDAAGNFTSASDTVQVDGTGPVLGAVNVEGQAVVQVARDFTINKWLVVLNGSVTTTGSPLNRVTVQLFDANNTPLSDAVPVTVNGNQWRHNYQLDVQPNGVYTVSVRATDQVGNETVRNAVANIDGTPPLSEIATEALFLKSGTVITGTAVDTGTVRSGVLSVAISFEPTTWDEQSAAHWLDDGLLLHLALDENSTIAAARATGISAVDAAAERVAPASADLRSVDQRSYVATGRLAQDASCSGAACPADGVRGALANSLRFDGVNDTLTVPWLPIYNPLANFSIGAWVNVGGSGRQPILTLPANGAPLWSLVYDGGTGKIVLERGSQSVASNVSLTPGVWQHLLFTVTGGTNATLYVNGGVAANFTVPAAALPVGTTLRLGSNGAAFFGGGLDDVVIYDRVLSAAEVARHARGFGAVLRLPLDGVRFGDGEILPETSRYQHEARLHLVNRSTIQTQFGIVGEGSLDLGLGEYISVPTSPVFDLSAGEFTQAAWVLVPDDAVADRSYPIFGGDLSVPAQSYPSLSFTGEGRVIVSFGDGTNLRSYTSQPLLLKGQSTFLAATFDGTTYRIYVNGVLAESTDLFAGSRPTTTTSFDIGRQRGAGNNQFAGNLDEVQLYRQALSADDIAALYAQGWQFAPLVVPPVPNLTWAFTIPVTLDGGYTIRLATGDGRGNSSFGGEGNEIWQGSIAPTDPTNTVDLYADDDGDGLVNGQEDLNGNGNLNDDDTDGDGKPDFKDNDDDGDGVPTVTEGSGDTDGDGKPDFKDNDDDGDGVPTVTEGAGDTDGDGKPDFKDNDDDGDGVPTVTEGAGDTDGDGKPDFKDNDDDGDGVPTVTEGTGDTDGDGKPDFKDNDDDGDGVPTVTEGTSDTDGDGKPDFKDNDDDGDGVPTVTEGTGDTDGDGKPDFKDNDDDGDGVSTATEGTGDTDGDGKPDFKDNDDDGDGVPTVTEGSGDTDGDGKPDFKDNDDDGDGVPTAEEQGDSNGNGVPDYLESNTETEHKRYLPLINR